MAVATLESVVELRQEEGVVADHSTNAEQRVAHRRAISLTVNFRMLREQLTKQGLASSRQSRHADKFRDYSELFLVLPQ